MSVLEVKNVSIRYITGDFKDIGLKEYTMKKLKDEYHVTEFWADQDISFTLEKGEMLGIIGTNGAGKSTLLKAVSGIMEPTKGHVKRKGNVAALLELASGFDGDLTVRENAYLRGAMLGYTRQFMDETYDQIIDFAELRDFQDRPFRQLSSGMKSRLAFSIASLVQPDLLILDEVLSVGDGAFRKKSEEKMKEIIAGGAATILVSHSIQQVRELCTKVLWLDHGRQIELSEDVEGVCGRYQEFLSGKRDLKVENKRSTPDSTLSTENLLSMQLSGKTKTESSIEQIGSTGEEKKAGFGVDRIVRNWYRSIPKTVKVAILAAFIFGFIVHMQSFSGFILNWDSTVDSYSPRPGHLLPQGKWLSDAMVFIQPFNIGSYGGICAILYISIAAGLVVRIIRVRSLITSALIGMLMVSFPSVMSNFSYAGEETFFFTMLMAITGGFLVSRGRYGYLWGTVLITLSLGNYPAYIGAVAAILLFLCILDLLQGEKSEKEVIIQGIKYIAVLLLSILLYYIILLIVLNITGVSLSSYRGIDSALTHPTIESIMTAIRGSYIKVIRFFVDDAYGRAFPRDIWCYRIFLLSIVVTIGVLIKKNRLYLRCGRLALTAVLLLLMPLAVHAIGVLGQDADTHWIMIYPFVFVFVFAVRLAEEAAAPVPEQSEQAQISKRRKENYGKKSGLGGNTAQWIVTGVIISILFNWLVTTNAGYTRLKLSYEGAYTRCVLMIDELMELPEYDPKKPLAVIGNDQTFTSDVLSYMRFTGITRGRNFLSDNNRHVSFIRDYLGIQLSAAPASVNRELAETEEFQDMPCYPHPGFAKEINGYMVIKLSDI